VEAVLHTFSRKIHLLSQRDQESKILYKLKIVRSVLVRVKHLLSRIPDGKANNMAIDPTALTALIISLVALIATFAQLLQQYFATADGYRQCLPEVMGKEWGSKTRKRMRWRELRYETIYYVPNLSIDTVSSADTKLARTDTYPFSIKWSEVDLSRKYILAAEEKTNAQLAEEGTLTSLCYIFTSTSINTSQLLAF
jgi:hypothetical protein